MQKVRGLEATETDKVAGLALDTPLLVVRPDQHVHLHIQHTEALPARQQLREVDGGLQVSRRDRGLALPGAQHATRVEGPSAKAM